MRRYNVWGAIGATVSLLGGTTVALGPDRDTELEELHHEIAPDSRFAGRVCS